jgi:hypothetical protein
LQGLAHGVLVEAGGFVGALVGVGLAVVALGLGIAVAVVIVAVASPDTITCCVMVAVELF